MHCHKSMSLFLVLALSVLCLLSQEIIAEELYPKTPADYEGPFYPVTKQPDIDNDLVQVKGQDGMAQGEILHLSGVVVNTKGEAQKDLTIEIWQTDPAGRYKHPGDSTPGERDPNFQYWGAAVTAADGSFFFKTIVPGSYEPRPAHIHYKVLQGWQSSPYQPDIFPGAAGADQAPLDDSADKPADCGFETGQGWRIRRILQDCPLI